MSRQASQETSIQRGNNVMFLCAFNIQMETFAKVSKKWKECVLREAHREN